MKNSQKLLNILCHQKKLVFLCVYKMHTFSIKTCSKTDVEAIKHNDKKMDK